MSDRFEVAIVGSGPAGASCAAFCAAAGLRTLLLERAQFPREKVCGDCLNPSCWPVLERLRVAETVAALPHGKLRVVEFIGVNGRTVRVALPETGRGEIAVKRSAFDAVLMQRARAAGAEVIEGATVTSVTRGSGFEIGAAGERFRARFLVAADGRNSTVARLCGLLPRTGKERVALQTHAPLPSGFGERVVLQLLREGYSGQAPVGEDELNICLVSAPADLASIKRWAEREFELAPEHPWRTITPLTRAPLAVAQCGLFLIGDAARVVEPFTGEGIYYALRSGELAAEAIARTWRGGDETAAAREFVAQHAAMYRGRLWVNRLARAAVLHPRLTSAALRFHPELLRYLTGKIVG